MKTVFYLIRHGQPDWNWAERQRFFGAAAAYMPLTPEGILQIEQTAEDPRLAGAAYLLASPYTRTMQSAAILSRRLDLPISVEWDLHEWLYDTDLRGDLPAEGERYCMEDMHRCFYQYMEGGELQGEDRCETVPEIRRRVLLCLARHCDAEKVIVVCHEGVIRSITGRESVALGEIVPFCLEDVR